MHNLSIHNVYKVKVEDRGEYTVIVVLHDTCGTDPVTDKFVRVQGESEIVLHHIHDEDGIEWMGV